MTSSQTSLYAEPGIDSFRRKDGLAHLQRAATWVVPLALLIGLVGVLAFGQHWDRRYSPGPVANVHAVWNDRCDVCHATAQPLSADNWLGRIRHDTHTGDANCSKCHQGSAHHEAEKPGDAAACTACHREHQGERASLLRVPDEQCTRCHADLPAHSTRSSETHVPKVTAFDGDINHHPGFELTDTGRLKFNHKLHMTTGIRGTEDKAVFSLDKIPEGQQARYAMPSAAKDTPVQLQCSSCHQLDAGDVWRRSSQSAQPARPAGAYFLPISYEIHCQACHPLTVGHTSGHKDDAFLHIPHRLGLQDIRAILTGSYAPRYLRRQAELAQNSPPRPLPGRPPRRGNQLQDLEEAMRSPVARAEQELYETRKGCVLCHDLASSPQTNSRTGEPAARRIVPTDVPTVWLRKAAFDHATHRLLECRSCHPRADAYLSDAREAFNPQASHKSCDVLVPSVDNCFACHSSARQLAARSDCVECHRYHNGDSPLEGKGSSRRGPTRAVSLEAFFAGHPPSEP